MSRNLMPQSGAFAPYIVVNRDAAVAGVFSVDGLRGSVDLTTKYLTIANFNAYKSTTDGSISSINQSITALNTAVSNKAAKGANSDITSITGLTTALDIAYGGTGGKTAAEARINLGLDRVVQISASTNLNYPTKNAALVLRDSDLTWGVYDNTSSNWQALGIAQGGTGARDATGVRTNIGVERFQQLAAETNFTSPNGTYKLLMDNGGQWGAYDLSGSRWRALGLTQGGTGATTRDAALSNLGITYVRSGTNSSVIKIGDIYQMDFLIGGDGAVGAYNPQTVGGITYYTHYYRLPLPMALPNGIITAIASLSGDRFGNQNPGYNADVKVSRDKDDGSGLSTTYLMVSVKTPQTGWVPYFHIRVVGY